MSSFFTTPASQRKRKRSEATSSTFKKRNVTSSAPQSKRASRQREDSISGSESSEDDAPVGAIDDEYDEESASSEGENETAAEKRLRLAERYLENIRDEVEDTVGFDAAEIDRDLIAERLVEDVAETKGKIYRSIAGDLDFEGANSAFGKSGLQRRANAVTGCAVRLPYAWTIGKDMLLEKWELMDPKTHDTSDPERPANIFPRRKPKRVLWRKGNKALKQDTSFLGHTGPILSIAISDSGKFLATGDETSRLIIWDADTLTPRRLFTQHRAAVTSLSFRRGTEQLFSASADRTIKIWSASELAYIETLFGHQDSVIGIAGGFDTKEETCVSVGGRDRTARLWKVVEENQLVFRGGGFARHKGMEKLRKGRFGGKANEDDDAEENSMHISGLHEDDDDPPISYAEGSIDCVAFLDAQLFVTGSDNGALSLWSVLKKKALFTLPLSHGRDDRLSAEQMSANVDAATTGEKGPRLARYVTSIATVPFADLILTGSWDGWVRAWRVGADKRTIEPLGKIGQVSGSDENQHAPISGIITGLSVCERGDKGKDGFCVVAAVGTEPRLGRWMQNNHRNGIAVFELSKKFVTNGSGGEADEEKDE